MGIEQCPFGKTSDGQAAELYTISNKNGMKISASSFGGAIQK